MNRIAILILVVLTFSCNTVQEEKQNCLEPQKGTVRVILVDKYTCQVPFHSLTIKNSDLYGSWTDSLNWEFQKKCWYGIYNIDKRFKWTLFPSRKYYWTETNVDSTDDRQEQGEWWTYTRGDSSFIVMMHNAQQDTIFKQGQQGYGREYLIYNITNRKITIRAKIAEPDSFSKYIVELIR